MTDRLSAYVRLLARTDPADLRSPRGGRGHRQTVLGKPDRFDEIWLHSARAWTQHELAARVGVTEGWKPSERERPVRRSMRRAG